MRVLIDATALPANRGGVGRYVDELVARLPGLGIETHVVAQTRDRQVYNGLLAADRVHVAPGWTGSPARRFAWEQTGLPALALRVRPDVLHSPHYTMPLGARAMSGAREVVTLHDATFFSDPHLHLGVKARFFRSWTRVAAARADALVAPSDATKDEVLRHSHADPATITVIPHGVDHDRFRPPSNAEVAQVRSWLGLASRASYLAFLGTLEPRKNVPALVRAYVSACADRDNPPVLVVAGGKGWDESIDAAVAAVPYGLTVLRPGFVPDGMVPGLLGGAEVVAYPAFGEGFGLPVLEAMACGAPVLTTRRLSLPEVGGDAVCYAESPDTSDIAAALVTLLDDADLRKRLAAAGVTRAASYTWGAAAAAHRDVYLAAAAR